ncbi:MAG: glycosyltransferase, partial [Desulfovibrionaceae bacterium]
QQELFTENVHLLTYPLHDVGAAAAQVRALLDDPPRQQALRQAALACINAGHRARHRAQEFTRHLHTWYQAKGQQECKNRQKHANAIRKQWLRMPYLLFAENISHPMLQQAYVRAAQGHFGQTENF